MFDRWWDRYQEARFKRGRRALTEFYSAQIQQATADRIEWIQHERQTADRELWEAHQAKMQERLLRRAERYELPMPSWKSWTLGTSQRPLLSREACDELRSACRKAEKERGGERFAVIRTLALTIKTLAPVIVIVTSLIALFFVGR